MDMPNTFRMNGYDYEIIQYYKGVALYSQSLQVGSQTILVGYEVHLVSALKKYALSAHGKYPLCPNSKFGIYGWSYQKIINAENKFMELIGE